MNEKIFVTKTSMPTYEEYTEAIKPLWNTHWLTNMGMYHRQLETELKEYLGVAELSLMVNGHMALELAIQSFGFPEGSEVITTPFTFISTTHAIVRNHLTPIFCDVKDSDGTIDENRIEELITGKTVAIVPVHVYGHVCNVEKIETLAKKHGLKVIYDAAHAFGVKYKGKGIGAYGDASIFSFHATKVFSTVEGGAVSFSNSGLYEKLYNLKNFGIRSEEIVSEIGANAKMNELCAIMGLCNLKHIDDEIRLREAKYNYYKAKIIDLIGISIFESTLVQNNNYAYLPILVTEKCSMNRDEIYNRLRENNIFSRKYFYPLTSEQLCFKNKYKNIELPNAQKLSKQILVLPLYSGIEYETIDRITEIIANAISDCHNERK